MVNELRTAMTLASAPTPSVEAILHAALPFKYVDHTHADAVVTLTNSRDGEALIREAYGDTAVVIPYVMPGFDLARLCAERFPAMAGPGTVGMVLLNHGIFSFGDTARESYERMIELVRRAEELLERRGAWALGPFPETAAGDADPLAIARLRHDVSRAAGFPVILASRRDPRALAFARREDVSGIVQRAGHAGPRDPHQAPAAGRPGGRGLRRRLPLLLRRARPPGSRRQDDARSGAAGDPRSRAGPR